MKVAINSRFKVYTRLGIKSEIEIYSHDNGTLKSTVEDSRVLESDDKVIEDTNSHLWLVASQEECFSFAKTSGPDSATQCAI